MVVHVNVFPIGHDFHNLRGLVPMDFGAQCLTQKAQWDHSVSGDHLSRHIQIDGAAVYRSGVIADVKLDRNPAVIGDYGLGLRVPTDVGAQTLQHTSHWNQNTPADLHRPHAVEIHHTAVDGDTDASRLALRSRTGQKAASKTRTSNKISLRERDSRSNPYHISCFH
jgi:hypothetical protein